MTRSFDVFLDLRLNKQLSKQSRRRWFETPSPSLWHHCNVRVQAILFPVYTTCRCRRITQIPRNQLCNYGVTCLLSGPSGTRGTARRWLYYSCLITLSSFPSKPKRKHNTLHWRPRIREWFHWERRQWWCRSQLRVTSHKHYGVRILLFNWRLIPANSKENFKSSVLYGALWSDQYLSCIGMNAMWNVSNNIFVLLDRICFESNLWCFYNEQDPNFFIARPFHREVESDYSPVGLTIYEFSRYVGAW